MASTGSSTPVPTHPAINPLKRKSIVYVDIPPSPLHSANLRKFTSQVYSARRKENNPLSPRTTNHEQPIPAEFNGSIKKRKLSEANAAKCPVTTKPKKLTVTSNATAEFPNGYFYCHQCNKKRDEIVELQCTTNDLTRCKTKYCKMCVKNRYGENSDDIKALGIPSGQAGTGHVLDAGYLWKCPKCRNNCNCCRCRKAKGLEPTGNLTREARKVGNSAAELLAQNPNATGILPGKGLQVVQERKESKIKARKDANGSELNTQTTDLEPKVKAPRVPRKIRVSEPKWEPVPTELDRIEAESRFQLREFALRFAPLMNISAKHLEDLDDFDGLTDACAKALILNLLDLIAADAEPEVHSNVKKIIKKISGGGVNPNAIWTNLAILRDFIPASVLRIPEPKAPALEKHRTRRGGQVTQAIQLVPILAALVEAAVQGASVREEIDNGMKDMKEANREYWAACREENDRWSTEKREMTDEKDLKDSEEGWDSEKWSSTYKSNYDQHKATIEKLDYEHAYKIQAYVPRYQPLGRDLQGRIYYISTALTPKKLPTAEDRASLTKWSWFLAVWGKGGTSETNIEGPKHDKGGVDDGTSDEKWWGFSDPKEIKKLAKWIAVDANLKNEVEQEGALGDVNQTRRVKDATSRAPSAFLQTSDDEEHRSGKDKAKLDIAGPTLEGEVRALIKGLNDYADFLTWHIDAGNSRRN